MSGTGLSSVWRSPCRTRGWARPVEGRPHGEPQDWGRGHGEGGSSPGGGRRKGQLGSVTPAGPLQGAACIFTVGSGSGRGTCGRVPGQEDGAEAGHPRAAAPGWRSRWESCRRVRSRAWNLRWVHCGWPMGWTGAGASPPRPSSCWGSLAKALGAMPSPCAGRRAKGSEAHCGGASPA